MQTFIQNAGSKMIQLHYSGNHNYLAADLQIPAMVNKIARTLSVTNFNPVCCVVPFTFRVDVIPPGSLFSPENPTGLFDNTGKLRVCYSPREHRRKRSAGRLCA